jgi:hypothetical protein
MQPKVVTGNIGLHPSLQMQHRVNCHQRWVFSFAVKVRGLLRSSHLKQVVLSGHILPHSVKKLSPQIFHIRILLGDQAGQRLNGLTLGRIYTKCFYNTTTQANMMQTRMSGDQIRKIGIGLEQCHGRHLAQIQSSASNKL